MAIFDVMDLRRRRVVIVGAGFGGLALARALASLPVEVVLVDTNNYHCFQPLLYQVASAGLDGEDVCYPLRAVFRHAPNVHVVMGEVRGGDLDAKVLELADGGSLSYDELVIACGALTADFSVPGVAEHAYGLKSLEDALALRSRLLGLFEKADSRPELSEEGMLNLVIVGGGPTGVELAGGMAELFDRSLRRDFPRLNLDETRIVLIEAADRLLGGLSPASSKAARGYLEARGVEVRLGLGVSSMDARGIHLADGSFIPAATKVWAAGIRAHPLAAELGLPTLRNGRIVLGPELRVAGRPEIYAIGDVAAASASDGSLLPQIAPVAIQEARYCAKAIRAGLEGRGIPPFVYRDKGTMATIGRHSAVTELPSGLRLSGGLGWLAWLFLHLVMLMGFRNRIKVFVNWAWNYFTYDRSSRIIMPGTVRKI